MDRVAIRSLRNNTAEVLARVKAGEIVELTEHGQAVARIIPLTLDRWDQLRLLGEIEPPEDGEAGEELVDVAAVEPSTGVEAPSEILARLRAGER